MSTSSPDTPPPRGPTPVHACDCHVHIYDERYPFAPAAASRPPHSPVAAYREVQRSLGLTRVVLVQPIGYAFDNRCLLDALAQFGSAARGVVIVSPGVSDTELQHLDALGVRGVRLMMLPGGPLPWEAVEPLAKRIWPLGWHINLQLDGRELPQRKPLLDRLPVPVVIDHTGKFLEPVSPGDEAFRALLAVLDRDDRWVKLSAPYETSRVGPPQYDDVGVLAQRLARTHPERCLWASNWPHPHQQPRPGDAPMLDWLWRWTDDDATRQRILVYNPVRLYGFERLDRSVAR